MEKVDMILLMGGKSRRMGEPKAYLHYKGKTFYEIIVSELSQCGDVYISIDKKEHMLFDCHYTIIEDDLQDLGPLMAIYSALSKVKTEYAFVTACDMPFINKNYIQNMLKYIDTSKEGVFVKDDKGRIETLGVIYSKKMLPKMKAIINMGLKKLLLSIDVSKSVIVNKADIIDGNYILENINTKEEYNNICANNN